MAVYYRGWLDRLIISCLCIIIFTLPFSKSAVEICFAIALALWALKKIFFHEPHIYPAHSFKQILSSQNLPIYLFVFACFISILHSASIVLSVKGLFFKLLEGVLLYFIAAETISGRKKLSVILAAIVLSILLISADGIFQLKSESGRDFLRGYSGAGRITASFNTPNGLGGWITIMLPLVLGTACAGGNRWPNKLLTLILWPLAGVLSFGLVLTRSRGALIGTVFAMIFFAIYKRSRIFLIAVGAIVAILSFIILYSMNFQLSFMDDFLPSLKNNLVQVMLKMDIVRTHLWREALLIIRDFPVFGCGLNTYSIVAPIYKSALPEAGIYPHNSYLQMAAETGIVGLASFILVIISLFKTSIANMRKIKNTFYNNVLLGLLAGLFGFLVHSFFDVNFYALQLAILMWFIMGLIIAVQKIALKEEGA